MNEKKNKQTLQKNALENFKDSKVERQKRKFSRSNASIPGCKGTRKDPLPSKKCTKNNVGVVECGVMWCGVVWCGVVWCGVWCGVWCDVV